MNIWELIKVYTTRLELDGPSTFCGAPRYSQVANCEYVWPPLLDSLVQLIGLQCSVLPLVAQTLSIFFFFCKKSHQTAITLKLII